MTNFCRQISRGWGLPQCVGAIYGSHIPIFLPDVTQNTSITKAGTPSFCTLWWMEGDTRNASVGVAGSLHNARVLRLSGWWHLVDRGLLQPLETKNICGHEVGYFLLCDAAYSLKSWLLKLFMDSGRLTTHRLLFWLCMSSCCITVKHAFGRLKGRWRCLLKRNDCSLNKVKSFA